MISKYRNTKIFCTARFYFICIIQIRLKGKRYPIQMQKIQISRRIGFQNLAPTHHRWDRIRITGIDPGRILRFSFGPGVINLWKTGPGTGVTFPFQQ